MKKLFIPYELALKAKKNGYPQSGSDVMGAWELKDNYEWLYTGGAYPIGLLVAPLYQQIEDWLRINYGWLLIPVKLKTEKYSFKITQETSDELVVGCLTIGSHNFYYEAFAKAIKEAFDIIEKSKK